VGIEYNGGPRVLNGLTGATQTFAVASSGTDFVVSSATGVHTFNLPDASATARGLITTGTQTIAGVKTLTGLLSTTNEIQLNDSKGIYFGGSLSSPFVLGVSGVLKFATSGFYSFTIGNRVIGLGSDASLSWSSTTDGAGTKDIHLVRDAAGILAQRNSTNVQTFRVYGTYTSGTSLELLQARGVASANFEFGPMKGSAGGTLRGLTIGGYATESASITPWLTFTNAGVATLATDLVVRSIGFSSASGNQGDIGWSGTTLDRWASNRQMLYIGGTLLEDTYATSRAWTFAASTTGSPTLFSLTGPAHTTLALSTEATDVNFNLARTVQFATGALTTQRTMRIQAPTYSFVGASTITNAATLELSPPVAGTNATITNTSALVVNFADTSNTKAVRIIGPGTAGTVWRAFDIVNGASTYFKVDVYGLYGQTFEEAAGTGVFTVLAGKTFNLFSGNAHITGDSNGLYIQPQVGHNTQFRSGTNAQSLGVYGTYTSSTSYERINVRGKASANFEIGPENGSAGGTLRGLTIGGYSAGSSTITPWLSFTSGGDATFSAGALFSHANGITSNTSMWVSTFGANGGFRSLRANGTSSAPTQVLTGDLLGFYSARGYHSGGAYHTNHGGYFGFAAAENFTSGAQGTTFQLQTTTNGASSPTERMFIDSAGVTIFGGEVRISGIFKAAKLFAQLSAEITNTPTGTTQTITLNDGNHQTLTLTSSTGTVDVTLTVPSNVSSGTLIVKQHGTTPRNITWAVSAGSIKWMGTQPTWSSDAVNDIRIVSWRYDGSVMYLMSTDKAA
jgi:hypothetical protein